MKRFILSIGVCLLAFSLAACGNEKMPQNPDNTSSKESVSTVKNDDLIKEYV